MKKYFITATDTDAGKTFVSCALAYAFAKAEKKIASYKPVAAGCEVIEGVLVNEDALLLSQFSNCDQTINEINPICLKEPIAPHIAAANVNRKISFDEISQGYDKILSLRADIILTEGAGGWRLPLNDDKKSPLYLSDFVVNTKQDVILVVNMKLGCLNHALLTYQAIGIDGLNCVAWVAICANEEEMLNLDSNIASLEQLLPIPKIAQIAFDHDSTINLHDKICNAANCIDLSTLLT